MTIEIGRNDPCHCGSGKKYKKCHMADDQAKESKALKKAQFAPRADAVDEKKSPSHKPGGGAGKSWIKNVMGKVGLGRPGVRKASTGSSNSGSGG